MYKHFIFPVTSRTQKAMPRKYTKTMLPSKGQYIILKKIHLVKYSVYIKAHSLFDSLKSANFILWKSTTL